VSRVAVIDHGAGNLVSIGRGLERAGADVVIVTGPEAFNGFDGVVLPGVGTTGAAMDRLDAAGLSDPLRRWDGPLLGICVGLQLFFDESEEDGSHGLGDWSAHGVATRPDAPTPGRGIPGESELILPTRLLGLVPGAVRRLEGAPRLPHIGWNDVELSPDPIFAGIPSGTPFYFVHSFAPTAHDDAVVIGRTTYGEEFTAAVRSGSRVGVQFHPERSGEAGLRLLGNFVVICEEARRAA
jgi:glutamine amidotransferase